MRGCSSDLRKRIIRAYDDGEGSIRELAVRFDVSPRTISRYLALLRDTGSFEERVPQRCGPAPKIDDEVVRQVVTERPDATEDELVELLVLRTGVRVDRSTVGRALRRMGITRKKRPSSPVSRTQTRSRSSSRVSSTFPQDG